MTAYTDAVLADSPTEFWKLDEATATTAASVGGGGHGATATGTAVVTGKDGNARSFDGVDDYLSAASVADFMAQTNYTLEAWFKLSTSDTNGTDWRTIIRRDGSGVAGLIRIGGSTSGIQQGAVQTYINGRIVSTGTTRFDDNAWHHVVMTKANTTIKLFVDGTEYTTASGTYTAGGNGATTTYLGSQNASSSEIYKGSLDSVAIYHTALSPTRISAHYTAASQVNAGYTAQVMTASATAPDAVGAGNVQTVYPTEDAYISGTNSTNYGSNTVVGLTSTIKSLIKVPVAVNPLGHSVATKLYLHTDDSVSSSQSVEVRRIDADWTEGTVTGATAPASTLIRTVTIPTGSGSRWIEIDVSGAAGTYGVMLSSPTWSSGTLNLKSSEYSTNTALRPYAVHTITPDASVSVSGGPITAAATMPNASVATTANGQYGAQAMAASASMPNATVSAQQFIDVSLSAEPMDAYASWPTSTGFTVAVNVSADAMTASATSVDAAVATQRGPRIFADPMTASADWKKPATVNGNPLVTSEVDDKFFQRVMADGPSSWFRLNDTGSTAADRMQLSVDATPAYYEGGVLTGRNDGPDGRHSVRFLGNGFFREHNETDNRDLRSLTNTYATLMFYIRTDKKNQFLMYSGDTAPTTGMLYLKNGRIHQKNVTTTTGAVAGEAFTGFTDIADGKWHQIVLTTIRGASQDEARDGTYVYIDGKFEVRRWIAASPWIAVPDYIGAIPAGTLINPGVAPTPAPSVPSSENFVGDMSEVVFYNKTLNEYSISRHYYDFMAWNPIEAISMDASATMVDAQGRGNQKRALYLWWDAAVDAYNVLGGTGFTGDMNHDPVLAGHGVMGGVYDLEGYKVFSKSVTLTNSYENYYDNVYDQPTLIDLEYHVDVNDYDVIMFGDWPDEGVEDDVLAARLPRYKEDKERLLRQLRDANDAGIGLLVTHPRMAVDLGIVDRVEFIPTLKEFKFNPLQGNAGSLYDYGSAVKFPWNITFDAGLGGFNLGAVGTGEAQNTNPAYLSTKAFFYDDMNFNNKFRVRAVVEGLTDIPSYMIKDAVYHVDRDVWGDTVSALDLIDRRTGLVIGDEFIFHGTNPAGMDWGSWDYDGERAGRGRGYYATPLANVKAGTVVTTFGTTHYRDQSQVENPYKDFATTIVLDRGDILAGRPVGGRIFVSFTEQPNRFNLTLPVNILPGSTWDDGSATWPNSYPVETNAQRDWEFSETRISATNSPINGRIVETSVVMPDGSVAVSRATSSGGLIYANYTALFDIAVVPKWDMTRRGMYWVGRGERAVEGEVRVGAEPMNATAQMPDPVVTAQRDNTFAASPMTALAQMPKVAEDESGDVDITTLPWTASATFTGFSRVITAAPMEATAEFVENFDMVHASGEQVVLTLHGVDATLYLKEEN